jgi:hypothetical protein
MADRKITDLTELTTVDGSDLIYVVDVSDTTESPQGTSKKITKDNFSSGGSSETLNIIQNVGLSTHTLNTWRTWTKEQGLWTVTNSNLGTGLEPTRTSTNYENQACFFIQEKTELSKFTWWWRRGNLGDYEVLVRSYDWDEDTGAETNEQDLVSHTFTTGQTLNNHSWYEDCPINAHTLSANTVVHLFIRQTSGTATTMRGIQFTWQFI